MTPTASSIPTVPTAPSGAKSVPGSSPSPFHQCATCGKDSWQMDASIIEKGVFKPGASGPSLAYIRKHEQVIESARAATKALDGAMRELSLAIHGNPELGFKESFAADTLCTFMESQEGWEVNRGICDLPTAWSATWTSPYGKGPRTIGFNSEMDALPGIGHACGHNLIAVAGLASAIATAKALEDARYPGTVVLLGTPAEEGGGGKCLMLERGAYDGMDACMMVHPGPFDCVGSSLAVRHFTVRFRGKTAHAAATPWAGVNALDAAVLAYNGVSVLRQQTEDGIRIQGIMLPETDWAPNVIPDVARLSFGVRAPTVKQMNHYMGRVLECFRGAAISTGCSVEISEDEEPYYDIVVNSPLAEMYASLMDKYEGIKLATNVPFSGSTDFGNVTHKLPGLHPLYEIPLDNRMKDANHTIGFTKAAATKEAHEATMRCAASIAATAALFVTDDAFADAVVLDWKEQQRLLAEQESCE